MASNTRFPLSETGFLLQGQVKPAIRATYWCSVLEPSKPVVHSPPNQPKMRRQGFRDLHWATSDDGSESSGASSAGSASRPMDNPSETQSTARPSSTVGTSVSENPDTSNLIKASKPARPFNTQSSYASPEKWEIHRAEITRLYLDQDKTLREVKEHMEKTHNFFATEKMYKTRIKKWALDKNNKMDEVVYMARVRNQRAAMGKTTEFTIRNRVVDWKDIERYMNRTPAIQVKIDDPHLDLGNSTFGIVCRTPSPDPAQMMSVPPILNTTRYLTLQEEIMALLRDYMDGAFAKKLWVNSPGDNCCHGHNGIEGSYRLSHWHEGLEVAGGWEADEADTIRLINIQMDQIRDIIRDEEPSLLSCFTLFHHSLALHRISLTEYVCPFVASMCEVVLGSQHPMTRLWSRVIKLPLDEFLFTLERTAKFRFDYFSASLEGGQRNWTSVFSLCQYAASLSPNSPAEVERITRLMIRDLDMSSPLRYQLDTQIMRKLASLNIASGNYETAAGLLERLKDWIIYGEALAPPYFNRLVSGYYRELALLYMAMGRKDEASALLRKNFNYCVETFGPTAFRTMRVAITMLHHNIADTPEEAAAWTRVVDQGRLEHLVKEMHYESAIAWEEPTQTTGVEVPIAPPGGDSVAGTRSVNNFVETDLSGGLQSGHLGLTGPNQLGHVQLSLVTEGFKEGEQFSRKSSATSAGSYYHSQGSSSSYFSNQSLGDVRSMDGGPRK